MTQEERLALQGMVRDLLSYTINQGLPFPDEFLGKGFKEHLRLARNAEEALLAVHFNIAELTKQVSRLKLESDTAFGDWFARLREMSFGTSWLGFLDLSGYVLVLQNFHNVNFSMSRLEGTRLSNSIFVNADLRGVRLENADLRIANLWRANFEGASFKNAYFRLANLRSARLEGANFEGAKLDGAILTDTILENKDS
jgi:uncharacterized protein YjbI with pentapeptide repeats